VNIFNEKLTRKMQKNYLIDGPVPGGKVIDILNTINEYKDAGGLSFFLGQVRADSIEGQRVVAIEYSA
jgi:molybdopterin synthase catalytic subunit